MNGLNKSNYLAYLSLSFLTGDGDDNIYLVGVLGRDLIYKTPRQVPGP